MTTWEQVLENAIIGQTVAALTDEGFAVKAIRDDTGITLEVKDDNQRLRFVSLVYGNGADVISDYSCRLESALKPALNFAAKFQS